MSPRSHNSIVSTISPSLALSADFQKHMSTSNVPTWLAGILNPAEPSTPGIGPNQNQETQAEPPFHESDPPQSNTSRTTSPRSSDPETEFDSQASGSENSHFSDTGLQPEHPAGYVIMLRRGISAKRIKTLKDEEAAEIRPGHYTTLAAANQAAEEQFMKSVRDMGADPDDPALGSKDLISDGGYHWGIGLNFTRDVIIDKQWMCLKVVKVNPNPH